jgi:hypothetical protein
LEKIFWKHCHLSHEYGALRNLLRLKQTLTDLFSAEMQKQSATGVEFEYKYQILLMISFIEIIFERKRESLDPAIIGILPDTGDSVTRIETLTGGMRILDSMCNKIVREQIPTKM